MHLGPQCVTESARLCPTPRGTDSPDLEGLRVAKGHLDRKIPLERAPGVTKSAGRSPAPRGV